MKANHSNIGYLFFTVSAILWFMGGILKAGCVKKYKIASFFSSQHGFLLYDFNWLQLGGGILRFNC